MGTNKPKSKSSSSKKNTTGSGGGASNDAKKFKPRSSSSVFTGACSELKGKTYDCTTYKQADRYILTTKAIVDYVGRTFNNGGDISASIQNETLLVIPLPADPADNYSDIVDTNGTVTRTARDQVKYVEDKLFSLELSSHMKRVSILESNIQK